MTIVYFCICLTSVIKSTPTHVLHLEYPVLVKQPADLNCGLSQVAFELNKRGNTRLYVLESLSPSVQLYTFLGMVIYPPSV